MFNNKNNSPQNVSVCASTTASHKESPSLYLCVTFQRLRTLQTIWRHLFINFLFTLLCEERRNEKKNHYIKYPCGTKIAIHDNVTCDIKNITIHVAQHAM